MGEAARQIERRAVEPNERERQLAGRVADLCSNYTGADLPQEAGNDAALIFAEYRAELEQQASQAAAAAPAPEEPRALATLSPRERDVVRCLQQGVRLSPLARQLGISTHTARNHLKHVFKKLGVRSQVELLFFLGGVRG